MNRKNTYRLIGYNCQIDFTSSHKLGSIANYKDLKSIGDLRYGRYFEIDNYDEYKKYVKGYGRGKILNISKSV